jgi:hypothetical protein
LVEIVWGFKKERGEWEGGKGKGTLEQVGWGWVKGLGSFLRREDKDG